jgi:hypothetical protein
VRSILAIFCCALALSAYSQNVSVKVDTSKALKLKPNFRPASVRVGTDLFGLIKSQAQRDFNAWEITADTEIHRYILVVDYGHSEERNDRSDSTIYSNNGNYWRVGIDANFLTRDPDRNAFFIGAHYGRSRYDEHMSIIPTQEEQLFWGSQVRSYANQNMKASWLELNTGLKVKIWKGIQLGYTARYKFGLSEDDTREMLSHNVPGYGRTNKETAWGFNYYIFYRIPFRPTTAILPQKKK